jgi:GTP-binding protein EngB required for normal cell division
MKFLPAPGLPEIVFLGRSNVGKSSLVNCLVGRKVLAPTSAVPGKTRRFVFYDVNNEEKSVEDDDDDAAASFKRPSKTGRRPRFWLVDVPGAGFAVDQHTGDSNALSTKVLALGPLL